MITIDAISKNNLNKMSEIIGLPIVLFDHKMEQIFSTHPNNEKVEEYQHAVIPVLKSVRQAAYPQIYLGRFGHVRSAIPYPCTGEIAYYVLLEVSCFRKLSPEELESSLALIDGYEEGKKKLLLANEEMKEYAYVEYVKMLKMIYYMIYREVLDESRLIFKSKEYIWEQSKIVIDGNNFFNEDNVPIPYIGLEDKLLQDIRDGNIVDLKLCIRNNLSSFRTDRKLNDLRSAKNFAIRSIALAAQAAKDGGVGKSLANSLADIYCEQVEKCRLISEVEVLYIKMYLEFGLKVDSRIRVESKSKKIRECCQYINDHIYDSMAVGEIAKVLSVSAEHLSRQFHRETGITIISYIKKSKMKVAEGLLAYSDCSVTEISAKLGFSGQSHFSYVFKREMGMTPLEYRKQISKNRI